MEIKLYGVIGDFAGNKDLARDIRINKIIPSLEKGENVTINFGKVESATQSFIHALISDVIRKKGIVVLEKVYFKDCNSTIRKIIKIVTEYMQHSS